MNFIDKAFEDHLQGDDFFRQWQIFIPNVR